MAGTPVEEFWRSFGETRICVRVRCEHSTDRHTMAAGSLAMDRQTDSIRRTDRQTVFDGQTHHGGGIVGDGQTDRLRQTHTHDTAAEGGIFSGCSTDRHTRA